MEGAEQSKQLRISLANEERYCSVHVLCVCACERTCVHMNFTLIRQDVPCVHISSYLQFFK